MKYNTITRKIQIRCEDVEFYKYLYDLNTQVYRMANRMMEVLTLSDAIANEAVFMKKVSDHKDFNAMFYGKEGVIGRSKQNLPYNLSSNEYPEVASAVRASLAQLVYKKYQTDWKDVKSGKKTTANFRFGMPIPFMKSAMGKFSSKGFTLNSFAVEFVYGRDRSGNETIVKNIENGEYSLCDSSIHYKGKKTFILLVIKIPKKASQPNPDFTAEVDITFKCPITITLHNGKKLKVGDASIIEHHRLRLQAQYQKAQAACKYNQSGHGRKRKMRTMDRFAQNELNTAKTLMHNLTREVVKTLVRYRVGAISIVANPLPQEVTDEELRKYVIRNFGYHAITNLISYKSDMENIKVDKAKTSKPVAKQLATA